MGNPVNNPTAKARGISPEDLMSISLDEISSNHKLECVHCGDPIMLQNYSGWEAFTDGRTTQPICKYCNSLLSTVLEKESPLLSAPSPPYENDFVSSANVQEVE